MKHFIYSKTFWAAIIGVGIEFLTSIQSLPFITDNWAHAISILLLAFIAINRAGK